MAEINFSLQDTGTCPYCKYHTNCIIQDSMTETIGDLVCNNYDDEMEIVIYKCPNFESDDIIGIGEDD